MTVARTDDPNAACFDVQPLIRLRISGHDASRPDYPTDGVQKGLTLEHDGASLSEEGVGFGLPLLKKGRETVFPGELRVTLLDSSHNRLCVEYLMNLRERLSLRGSPVLKGPLANSLKEMGALLHRSYPFARTAIMAVSNTVRGLFDVRTVFERRQSAGTIRMDYRFDPATGALHMVMDASEVQPSGVTELIVMNEQGASHFTEYVDSDGVCLRGRDIGTWFPVAAAEASFRDPRRAIRFSLRRIPGARLFRGRELARGRLAWAGFAYVLPPGTDAFRCSLAVGACP